MHRLAVERERLDRAVRDMQDGAAGRLVDAARLHADEAVLDQIDAADAVVAAELVEPRQQRRRRQRLAVDRDRVALLEADLDDGRLVGRLLGRDGALIDVRRRLDRRVLQHLALGGGVQQVGVDRERRLAALVLGDRDLVLLGELDQVAARLEVPFAPGRDHLDVGVERVVGELEAHLVVALAGGAMGDGVGAGLARRSRSAAWRSAAGRSRCRAGRRPRRARSPGTSGRRNRARTPRADPRRRSP